jgi:hypothetical protein
MEISTLMSGGGGGLPVSASIGLKQDRFVVGINDEIWLRSGVLETDVSKYPLAPVSPYLRTAVIPYQLQSFNGSSATIKNTYGLHNRVYLNTKKDLLWTPSGAIIFEYKIDGTPTGRTIFNGQSVSHICYNPYRNSIVSIDSIGQLAENDIDTGAILRYQTQLFVNGTTVSMADMIGFSFDGTYYVAAYSHGNQNVAAYSHGNQNMLLVYFDLDLNYITAKSIVLTESSSKSYKAIGFDIDIKAKIIIVTRRNDSGESYSCGVSVFDYDGNSLFLFDKGKDVDDTILGGLLVPPVVLRDYGLIMLVGQIGNALLNTNKVIYSRPVSNTFAAGITLFTDAGGFGWGLNPATKTIFKYSGRRGKISYFGQNYALAGITSAIQDFCGASNGCLWVLDGFSLVREYNLLGVATGKTITLSRPCRAMVTDGEFVYTLTYGLATTEVTKFDSSGAIVEVFLRPNMFNMHDASRHLAFTGEFWVAHAGNSIAMILDKDFNYLGHEHSILEAYYRPTLYNGYSVLGNILFVARDLVHYAYAAGRSFIPVIGEMYESKDTNGLPNYMRIK